MPHELTDGSSYLSYNKIARQWAAERKQYGFVSKWIKQFADKLPPGGTILDIGCGNGIPNAAWLSYKGFIVTGIDASTSMIQMAKEESIHDASFHVVNMLNFETDQMFDGVLAWDSLFHLPYEAQHSMYHRIASWIKPEGWFLFTHGNRDGAIQGDDMYGEKFFYSALDTSHVQSLLIAGGFRIENLCEFYKERDMDRDLVVLCQKNP